MSSDMGEESGFTIKKNATVPNGDQKGALPLEQELKAERLKLRERVKELEFLYRVLKLTARKKHTFEETIHKIVETVPSAFQFPARTCVRISIDGTCYTTRGFKKTRSCIKKSIMTGSKSRGRIEAYHKNGTGKIETDTFLNEEKRLIDSTAELLGVMLEMRDRERIMEKLTFDLQEQKKDLEEKNVALREILSQIEIEKRDMKKNIRSTAEKVICPLLQKLRAGHLEERERIKYIEMIETNLMELYSPFPRNIADGSLKLSPREIEISIMIKNGLSNKEIAELLHLSVLTIERHRHNVRRKLGIVNMRINLTTYLRNMQ